MRHLGALVAALFLSLVPATAASAAVDGSEVHGEHVSRYDAAYTFHEDGSVDVRLEFTYDFAGNQRRGPYLTLPTRQGYDDSLDRTYDISGVRASSPTGAPSDVHLEQGKYWLEVRIGDPDTYITGEHRYVLEYTVRGLAQPHYEGETATHDEVFFNIISEWTVPVVNITVRLDAPSAAEAVGCAAGAWGSSQECTSAEIRDGVAVFTQSRVDAYGALTLDILWPLGTMDTTVNLRTKNDFLYAFSANPATVGGSAGVLGLGIVMLSRRLRGKAVDEQYAGLTPGVAPVDEDAARVVKRDYDAPVAVQFNPPPGMRPGQLGTLIDERADVRDVTATIVDLAVRGYMRVEEMGDGTKKARKPKYQLVKLRDSDAAMVAYEKTLFESLFETGDTVELDDIKTTFASDLAKVQVELYKNVTDLGWFRSNPSTARAAWAGAGFGLLVLGGVATFFAAAMGPFALVPLPIVLLGVMVMATTGKAPARKAEGTRVLAQAQGFKLFLETADGNKLRYEEGHDIFSLYLPFAIAFDVAEKWTKTFEKLAAQGKALADPTWYSGHSPVWTGAFSKQVNSFTSLADAAISAPTPGASGGSGFSSGGGFSGSSGGGSFGGGGGSW